MSSSAVCHGAMLQCSQGTGLAHLSARPRGVGTDLALSLATVNDALPLVNIPPFGSCLAPAHPLATTGAAPCLPQTSGGWQLRAPSTLYLGQSALRADATLTCAYGGVIRVVQPGPQAIELPDSSSGV